VETIANTLGQFYRFGTYEEPAGEWRIVHAITQPGNSDAAMVVTGAYSDFGGFDVLLFVGVAGSLKSSVRLGSVVAGDYVYHAESAKVEDGRYLSRPHAHQAASELINAAKIIESDRDWVDLIKPPIGFELPSTDQYPCRYPPHLVVKAIASGEKVVAGPDTEAYKIIREYLQDAAAVEMEGWGVMTAAHRHKASAMIVRGISDMCGDKTEDDDEKLQPIASAHAAAVAFKLLSVRSKATPASPSSSEFETPASPPPPPTPDPRSDIVLRFSCTRTEMSQAEIEEVLRRLRDDLNDPELELLRIDEGSLRLVLSVRSSDKDAVTVGHLRKVVGPFARYLTGALSQEELREADAAKIALEKGSTGLLSWERALPGGEWLERQELSQIRDRFEQDWSSTVVLGEPGSGKSALLGRIAADLIGVNAPVLAIKADLVPADVTTEAGLQKALGLPTLPSAMMLAVSKLQPAFLIIDQLDALASQLDLKSERLNVLLNLVREVGAHPNVHVLLSARTFEFNHDVRLRAVKAEQISLSLPGWQEVRGALEAAGIDASVWPENAQDVVRNPQALKTFLLLNPQSNETPFSKYQSMLEELWVQRIVGGEDGPALAALASDIAGIMAEEETLWLAAARFDDRLALLRRLEALSLIVRSEDGKSIAYSHQTVFEYVLARSFVRAAGRLSAFVLERQNSLFIRAKTWSSLNYLRDAEAASYEREFAEIWGFKDLRRHLRLLLLEFIGSHKDPMPIEVIAFGEALGDSSICMAALKAMVGNRALFAAFQKTAVANAMTENDALANQAMRVLHGAWPFASEEVAALIADKWLPKIEYDVFTWATIDACRTWGSDLEEIAHKVLARSNISTWQVDYTASALAVEQPDVAFRLVRKKLDFLVSEAEALPPRPPLAEDASQEEIWEWAASKDESKSVGAVLEASEWHSLPDMVESEPAKFLDIVWPVFRRAFEGLAVAHAWEEDDYRYFDTYSVDLGIGDKHSTYGRDRPLILSLVAAIEGVARSEGDAFSQWVVENNNQNFMRTQELIAYGYTVAPDRYSDVARDWLLADGRRFQLGNSHAARQTTTDLVRAIAPHWAKEDLAHFVQRVNAYRPTTPRRVETPEQRRDFGQIIRATQTEILEALPQDELDTTTKQHVEAERRALGDRFGAAVISHEGGLIGSPMEAYAMERAKDRDIIRIFREIPDNSDWDHPRHWMKGGNIQLSRAFAEFAKSNPERALRIMEQFEPKAQERAAGYALEKLAETEAGRHNLVDAFLDLHERGFATPEFVDSAARAIEKVVNHGGDINDNIVAILVGWLNSDGETSDEVETNGLEKLAAQERKQSILWGHSGLSILPSGNFTVLSTLCSVLLQRGDEGRDRLLKILNDHLDREPQARTWQALLLRLSNAGGATPQIVSEFLRRLFARYPALSGTREAIMFLAHAQRWDDQLVFDLISDWGKSDRLTLRQAMGELVALVAIVRGSEKWTDKLERLIADGTPDSKAGMAYSAVNLWPNEDFHTRAATLLTRLVEGADDRRAAAILDLFRVVDELRADDSTVALLEAVLNSEIDLAGANSWYIVERLQDLLPHYAKLVAALSIKLVKAWETELSDVRTATAMSAPALADLALTLHRLGGATREAGVTVFETLIDIDAYGARDTLLEVDGRFRPQPLATRTRLRRRS
jgi:nucleoside phosphorylase